MKTKILSCLLLIVLFAFTADKPAYIIYNEKGKESSYEKMLADAKDADIVLFGELHNNSVCHWLEYELAKDLYAVKKENLVLGAEMYEADNQLMIDEYFAGLFAERQFKDEAKLWKNNPTDYKPMFDFAKDNKLKFVATNVPRRYASMVYKKGFEVLDNLDIEAKKFIAPLPIKYDSTLKCYADMLKDTMQGHVNSNLPKAQALKDATMAYFIYKNFKQGNTFIHYNGAYHSNDYQSIGWYLQQLNPKLKIVTISTTEQEDISKLDKESINIAHYVICIPESMTKTY